MASNITTPSLANLPGEDMDDITFRVARSNVKDVASLGNVSQAFRRHSITEGVRRVCHLGSLKFVPVIGYLLEIRSLVVAMTQLFQAGEGITSYFDNKRRERANEGLTQVEAAAARGHIKARYLYGIILIGSDLEIRDEGYNILETLMQPRLLESMCRMARLRDDLMSDLRKLQGGASNAANIVVEFHSNFSHCNYDDSLEKQIWTKCMDWVPKQSSLTP